MICRNYRTMLNAINVYSETSRNKLALKDLRLLPNGSLHIHYNLVTPKRSHLFFMAIVEDMVRMHYGIRLYNTDLKNDLNIDSCVKALEESIVFYTR